MSRLSIDRLKVEAKVRAMVIAILADPAHSCQIARTFAKLAVAQAKLDSARHDGTTR